MYLEYINQPGILYKNCLILFNYFGLYNCHLPAWTVLEQMTSSAAEAAMAVHRMNPEFPRILRPTINRKRDLVI